MYLNNPSFAQYLSGEQQRTGSKLWTGFYSKAIQLKYPPLSSKTENQSHTIQNHKTNITIKTKL